MARSFPGQTPGVGMVGERSLKRDRAPPLSYGAVATSGPGMVGAGSAGTRFPGTTTPFGTAAGFSGGNPIDISGFSVAGGVTTTMGAPANSWAVYSIQPKPFKSKLFNAQLFEKAQPYFVYRDPRAGTDRASSYGGKIGGSGSRYAGMPSYNHLDKYNVPRMHGNHPIVASLVLLNYILASTEPAADSPFDLWKARDIKNKWAFVGVARNQEGGQNYFGKTDDKGKDFIINLTINGRADSVYNVFGAGLTDVSPIMFIVKRVPRPAEGMVFYLDPHHDTPLRVDSTGSKRLVKNPYQVLPFQPTASKPHPDAQDLMGVNDFGEVEVGEIISVGRTWHMPQISNTRHASDRANDLRAMVTQPTTTVIVDQREHRLWM
jgi:hypothetical protein